jgi:DNA-binding MarR family transcriptional regulator
MDKQIEERISCPDRTAAAPPAGVGDGTVPLECRGEGAVAVRKRRLPPLLRRAWFGLNQTFRRFSAKAGITPDQFTVLRTLVEQEPSHPTQSELSEKITSDPNTITSLLRRMEAGGLIQRRSDAADRRARRIAVKPAGRRVYEQAAPLAWELQNRVLMSLPEERREAFLEDLETIANSCQNALKEWR